ncbi:MAG: HesA/MoeB/ThiF family protein [Succinivibrio sp.]
MELTAIQQERYARHIVLNGVGLEGQKKLLDAKVLVIGAGGLGSPAAMYLAAAGIGTLGIVDGDDVELSNLQRQIIHSHETLNTPKVESAKQRIAQLNSDVNVKAIKTFISKDNILELIADYDFVLDCTDNFDCKFLINDACVIAKKPFVHAGVMRFYGQLMTYVPGRGPCYRCVFDDAPPEGAIPPGKVTGIVGAVPGTIGSLQAIEAIKFFTGAGELLTGHLLTFDGLKMEFKKMKLPKERKSCPVCGKSRTVII